MTRYIHSTLLGISLTSLTGTGQFLVVRFGPGSDLEALLPGPLAGDSELGIATVTQTTRVGQACISLPGRLAPSSDSLPGHDAIRGTGRASILITRDVRHRRDHHDLAGDGPRGQFH